MAMHDAGNIEAVREHYRKCLNNGCDEQLARALAMRLAPGIKTDSTHFAGLMGRQFNDKPEVGIALSKELRAMGGSPEGKVYLSQVASYPGDPKGWVSSKDDIRDRLRESGDGCAALGIKPVRYADPAPEIPLDPDLVTAEVEGVIAANPEIAPTPKDRERLWNETYEKRLPPKHRDKRMLSKVLSDEGLA